MCGGASLALADPHLPQRESRQVPGSACEAKSSTSCLGLSDILLFHWIYLYFLFTVCYSAFPVSSNDDIKFSCKIDLCKGINLKKK